MNTQLLIESKVFCQKKQDGYNGTCLKQKLRSIERKRVVDREKKRVLSINRYEYKKNKSLDDAYSCFGEITTLLPTI